MCKSMNFDNVCKEDKNMTNNEISTLNEIELVLQEASRLSESGKVDEAVKLVEEAHEYYKNHFDEDNRTENTEKRVIFYQGDLLDTYPDLVRIIFTSLMMIDLYS